jgi:hypothetical protein
MTLSIQEKSAVIKQLNEALLASPFGTQGELSSSSAHWFSILLYCFLVLIKRVCLFLAEKLDSKAALMLEVERLSAAVRGQLRDIEMCLGGSTQGTTYSRIVWIQYNSELHRFRSVMEDYSKNLSEFSFRSMARLKAQFNDSESSIVKAGNADF